VNFARLSGLRLVLPRRPSHWRNALDEAARSLGFKLMPVAEADSLTVQKELVAHTPGLYSVLGPYSMTAELQSGRLQASKLVKPDLVRHVTLALPKQGNLSATCRAVAEIIQELIASWGDELTEPIPEVDNRRRQSTAQQMPISVQPDRRQAIRSWVSEPLQPST
jgi:DNA-binding transcriptional LysR family regulator